MESDAKNLVSSKKTPLQRENYLCPFFGSLHCSILYVRKKSRPISCKKSLKQRTFSCHDTSVWKKIDLRLKKYCGLQFKHKFYFPFIFWTCPIFCPKSTLSPGLTKNSKLGLSNTTTTVEPILKKARFSPNPISFPQSIVPLEQFIPGLNSLSNEGFLGLGNTFVFNSFEFI